MNKTFPWSMMAFQHQRKRIPVKFAVLALMLGVIMASSNAVASAHLSGDIVRTWNEVTLQTGRDTSANDAINARNVAMVNIAIYDAVNGIPSKVARHHALVSASGAPQGGHPVAAAAAAAHAVLVGLYPARAAMYNQQLATDIAAIRPGDGNIAAGQQWGASVGKAVWDSRAADRALAAESLPAGTLPGQFPNNWSGTEVRHWAAFGTADPRVYAYPPHITPPPAVTSFDYASEYAQVQLIGNAALVDPAKRATFDFWANGGGTSQPPGAGVRIAHEVSISQGLNLADTARMYALLGMAMADSIITTVTAKRHYRVWRPNHAIHAADGNPLTAQDTAWASRAGSTVLGGNPEFWSGHSAFGAVVSKTLEGFFCNDDIAYTIGSDTSPGEFRTYTTFTASGEESGLSRVLGGIHFERSGNQQGLLAGRAVAKEVLKYKLLLRSVETHRGWCPL